MKNMCALLLLTCAGTSLAQAKDTIPGEKWKVTTSMQMSGMSMPGTSSEICKQPGDDAVPVKTEDNCQIYDMQRSGNVQSFKMRCTGEPSMEGSMQLTYQGDRYQGKMDMTTQGEHMVVNYQGQKLGACDGSEANLVAKKMFAAADRQQQLANQQLIQECHRLAADAEGPAFFGMCKDPADKQTYCDAVRKPENFQRLGEEEQRNARYSPNNTSADARPLTESARVCGFALEQERDSQCKIAEQNGNLRFLATQCPAQAAGIAAAQCAGRRYTAISDRYRSFCSEYASTQPEQDQQQQQQPETPVNKTKGLLNKGKKALGGLFNN